MARTRYATIADDEESLLLRRNAYQSLVRMFSRASLVNSLALYIRHIPTQTSEQPSSTHLWLRGSALPLPEISADKVINTQVFINWFKLVLFYSWPLTFWGLFFHDLIEQGTNPRNNYGTSAIDVMGGTATNQATFSSQLGSDIVTDYQYWLWPALATSLPIVMGMLAGTINYLRVTYSSNPLLALEKSLLWSNKVTDESRRQQFDSLVEQAKNRDAAGHRHAISLLAEIVDGFAEKDLTKVNLTNETKSLLRQLRVDASTALQELTVNNHDGKNTIFTRLVAHYYLWSIGHHHKWYAQLFWLIGIKSLLELYADGRLLEIWIKKFQGLKDYLDGKSACEAKDGIWDYSEWWGKIVCTRCGNWPVYVLDQDTPQACLTGLLRSTQPVKFVGSALQQMLPTNNVSAIDFSQQRLASWSSGDWKTALQPFSQTTSLKRVIIASEEPINILTSNVVNIATSFSGQDLTDINVANLGISADAAVPLTQLWANSSNLQVLDLTGNNFNCNAVVTILDAIPASTAELRLGNNLLDGGCLPNLGIFATANRNLTKLVISGNNDITPTSLPDFYQAMANSNVSDLSMVGIAQSLNAIQVFSQYWPKNLTTIAFSGANLDDASLIALKPAVSHLAVLDLGSNTFSGSALAQLLQNLIDAGITVDSFILRNNQLLDDTTWIDLLNKLGLQSLDISDINLTDAEFAQLLPVIVTIPKINVANNQLGADSLALLANACSQAPQALRVINWSDNGTDETAAPYLQQLLQANITLLDISNNYFTDVTAHYLANAIASTQCKLLELNLADNLFTIFGAQVIFDVLPGSTLSRINLDGTPLGLAGVQQLAKNWITPGTPYLFSDGETKLSEDEQKALVHNVANTNLTFVSVRNTGIDTKAARLLCRTAWRAGSNVGALDLRNNPAINPNELDIFTCTAPAFVNTAQWNTDSSSALATYSNNPALQLLTHTNNQNNTSQQSAVWLASIVCPVIFGAVLITVLLYRYAWPNLQASCQRARSAWQNRSNNDEQVAPERPTSLRI